MAKRKFFTLPRMVSVSVMTAFAVFGRIAFAVRLRSCKRLFDRRAFGAFVQFLFRAGTLDARANARLGAYRVAFGFVNKL